MLNPQHSVPVSATETDAEKPFDTHALLARIWKQNLPLVKHRVDTLSRAALASRQGPLAAETRQEAADLAHKLAGSLGMFGYAEGTEVARQIEDLLWDGAPEPDSARLAELTTRLQSVVPLSE